MCPACSNRYCADAFHLLRAGLAGDDTKGVAATVVEHPRAFVTLTAPSFGPVHTRAVTPRGLVRPCSCGERHHGDDPRIGTALNPDSYDYVGAVLWQAHAGALWARFATHLRRALAAGLGVGARDWPQHGRLSFAKVAEYQRRGLVHFHAVVRLDGPDGPADPAPPLDHAALCVAVRDAARQTLLRVGRPDGTVLALTWGAQLDVRPVPRAAARQLEDDQTGEMTDAALAAYIAKYATKGTGAHEGVDRPIRDLGHVAHLRLPDHHRRMITTAWDLGSREESGRRDGTRRPVGTSRPVGDQLRDNRGARAHNSANTHGRRTAVELRRRAEAGGASVAPRRRGRGFNVAQHGVARQSTRTYRGTTRMPPDRQRRRGFRQSVEDAEMRDVGCGASV